MINDILCVAHKLQEENVAADVIKLDQVQPIQLDCVIESVSKTGRLLVVEEVARRGCVGETLLALLMEHGVCPKTSLINLSDGIVCHGDLNSLHVLCGLDPDHIYETAKELLSYET